MSDADFWASSYRKMKYLLDKLNEEFDTDENSGQQVQEIASMKQISGWSNG